MLEEIKVEIEKAIKLIKENPNVPAAMALNALLPEEYRVKFPVKDGVED